MKRIKKRKIVAPYENYTDLKRIKSLYEEEMQKSQFPVYRINVDMNLDKVVEETINIIEKIII